MATWTKERDYALAFGTGLGLSALQISLSMGDVSRNAIIGRWHRLGMKVPNSPNKGIFLPRKAGTSYMKKRGAPKGRKIAWSDDELATIRALSDDGMPDSAIAEQLPRRSRSAVTAMRGILGLRKRNHWQRYSDDDDRIIREEYRKFTEVVDIAKKIKRTVGSVRQRIVTLGLARDGRKTRLAARFGVDILKLSNDPSQILANIRAEEEAKRAELKAQRAAQVARALDIMATAIAEGGDRRAAFQAAMLAGATLQDVGDRVGLTRERIRQITGDGRKGPVDKPCAKCGVTFTANPRHVKYCSPECRESVYTHYTLKPPTTEQTCINCGNQFQATHGGQRYCGAECRNAGRQNKLQQLQQTRTVNRVVADFFKLTDKLQKEALASIRERTKGTAKASAKEAPKQPTKAPERAYLTRRYLK